MVKTTNMSATPRITQRTVTTAGATHVLDDDIGRRADALFVARGSEHGHDVEDWLVAEAELLNGNNMESLRARLTRSNGSDELVPSA